MGLRVGLQQSRVYTRYEVHVYLRMKNWNEFLKFQNFALFGHAADSRMAEMNRIMASLVMPTPNPDVFASSHNLRP